MVGLRQMSQDGRSQVDAYGSMGKKELVNGI